MTRVYEQMVLAAETRRDHHRSRSSESSEPDTKHGQLV